MDRAHPSGWEEQNGWDSWLTEEIFLYVKIPNIGCQCHAHHLTDGKLRKGTHVHPGLEEQVWAAAAPIACLCCLQKAQVAYQKAH